MKSKILVVDDEPKQREILNYILEKEGYHVFLAPNSEAGYSILNNEDIDVVITDLLLPGENGLEFMERGLNKFPEVTFLIITGHGTIDSAVSAIKKGAFDYIQKPLSKDNVLITLSKAVERTALLKERGLLYKKLDSVDGFESFIGEHPSFKKVLNSISRIAKVDTNVLITGQSGTGKDLAAMYIHKFSDRRNKPFIPVNCAAIPESLMESELFGYEKGAFTGATHRRKGLFESATEGTVFLDEISEIPLSMQVKLLRVIQNKEILPLGSNNIPIKIDVRIIAATNRNLEEQVRKGEFREDLFYRLNVFNINMPSLKERESDVPLLVNHFLHKYRNLYSPGEKFFSKDAIKVMLDYNWPGNIRELESFVQRVILMSDNEEINDSDVFSILNIENRSKSDIFEKFEITGNKSLDEIEKELIINTLKETGGNITKAAKKLGITFRTLQYRIGKYQIKRGIDD
ncbi:MAG: sigma-54 dependent transcriptional regulator [Calditerrivibrio sp.]|nr:sigma-54 dependent transcriptional regulator [Calditerrivibrio sp.]